MNQYLGWIPPSARKVIEFGCGVGDFGAMFKEVQPEAVYVGVEGDKHALGMAARKLDCVIDSSNVEKLGKVIQDLAPFDCVIYHQSGINSRFGMDIPLSSQGQVMMMGSGSAYDFPWRISKSEQRKSWDLVTLFSDPVCAFMRMIIPNSFYKTCPDVNVVEMEIEKILDGEALPKNHPYVVIFQRLLSPSLDLAQSIFSRLSSYGGLMIHEFDDWPEKWRDKYLETKYYDFVASHIVQTTTEPLGDYFRQFNPYVLVFPNELCNLPAKREVDIHQERISIFYGALNRREDCLELLPVIREAIQRYGDKLNFNVVAEREFYEALPTHQKKYFGKDINDGRFAPYEIYEQALHSSDIALLPLQDNAFNRMKSDLKFIEAAGHGAAALASPTVYSGTIEDGRTGLIYRDLREFREKLFLLIENIDLRHSLSNAAYEYVKHNRLMCQHYEERLGIYRELLAKRLELEQERQKRVAELW